MDFNKLIRDAGKVHSYLKKLPDSRVVTTKGCKIYVPVRYESHGLATVGTKNYIVGFYMMVVENLYFAVAMTNAMIQIEPSSTVTVDVDGDEYYEFSFDAGSTVFTTSKLIKVDTLVYKIFNEFLASAKVPFFYNYLELGEIFKSGLKHAGVDIGENWEIIHLLVSLISRDSKNRGRYYRQAIAALDELRTKPPVFIGLRNVEYGATNTLTKLGGSYFSRGVVSALNNPTERVERLETLLRQ